MKLLRLKLGVPFRSLAAGFEVDFLREWDRDRFDEFHPYCLAGRNGSGKSNVLEALAEIFYHIECICLNSLPVGFRFDPESSPDGFKDSEGSPDAFELEYLFPDDASGSVASGHGPVRVATAHIRIVKQQGLRPMFHRLTIPGSGDSGESELSSAELRGLLPRYILGYSSGHNEILSLPFFKMRFIHFDEYCGRVARDDSYDGKPEGRMVYLDDQFSQAILLCHFLFPSEAVTKVFQEKAHITGIRRFRIIIRRHHRVSVAAERLESMSVEDKKDTAKTTVELTTKLAGHLNEANELQLGLIDKLIKCSTTYFEEEYTDQQGVECCDLLLDYWLDDATRRAFRFLFGNATGGTVDQSKAASALNLFQSLQLLLTLNQYKVPDETKSDLYRSGSLYVNETIPMPASDERIMRFKDFELIKAGVSKEIYVKSLSDGEHQLLHTIGLCLLYRHESALFLLDEPETHLNPDWRASYISTLRAALEADAATKNVMREVLLTSHSPFIISDCRKENVLVFKKDPKTQAVTCERPDFETFGASATLITNEIFDRQETIGDFANAELKRIESLAGQQGQDRRTIARQLDRTLGDSIEKTLALGRIVSGS